MKSLRNSRRFLLLLNCVRNISEGLPSGYTYLINDSGAYLLNDSGAYLIV